MIPGQESRPDGRSGRLGPHERAAALTAMAATTFDVVVVGGGVVGAGAALDAATRGLSVALLEARDWASGTSSRSSKLIHGGLRYLEMLDFGLVAEALRERGLIVTQLAPHLARPVPFLYPLKHRIWERAYVAAGVTLYDVMARTGGHSAGLPLHKHLTRRQALRVAPGLRKDALVGAVQYYDAQLDDARHTMNIVRTAAAYGAVVANRARVVGFLREGERVVGVRVRDQTSKLSREHVVAHPVPGLVVVAGGKYTTYRVMAKDAVDEAARALDFRVAPSCTDEVPLLGAEGYRAAWNARHRTAARSGLHVARIEHLLQRYGSMIDEVLELCVPPTGDPALGRPLPGAEDYLAAEIVYAASHEGARHLDDALARRTRISIETWDRGVSTAPHAARLMGGVLGWSEEQLEREVQHYLARVEAERTSQQQPDDETA